MPFSRKDLKISLGVKKCLALHVCSAVVCPPAPPGSISSCWVKVGKKVGVVSAVVTCLVKSHFSSARLIFAYCSSVCILTQVHHALGQVINLPFVSIPVFVQ